MSATPQEVIEGSLYKYLKTNLASSGIKVYESPYGIDLTNVTKWVVIDPLTIVLGVEPKALFFLHCGVKNKDAAASSELAKIASLLIELLTEQQPIELYSNSNVYLGDMYVTSPSIAPVTEHAAGGLKRSFTIGLCYIGN